MGGGMVVSFLSYQFVEQNNVWRQIRPLTVSKPMVLSPGSPFAVPQNQVIETKLLFVAACFGAGWGITGLSLFTPFSTQLTEMQGSMWHWVIQR